MELTQKLLARVEARLRRIAKTRGNADLKKAYVEAAKRIHSVNR